MKKILLSLGSLGAIVAPVVATISCGTSESPAERYNFDVVTGRVKNSGTATDGNAAQQEEKKYDYFEGTNDPFGQSPHARFSGFGPVQELGNSLNINTSQTEKDGLGEYRFKAAEALYNPTYLPVAETHVHTAFTDNTWHSIGDNNTTLIDLNSNATNPASKTVKDIINRTFQLGFFVKPTHNPAANNVWIRSNQGDMQIEAFDKDHNSLGFVFKHTFTTDDELQIQNSGVIQFTIDKMPVPEGTTQLKLRMPMVASGNNDFTLGTYMTEYMGGFSAKDLYKQTSDAEASIQHDGGFESLSNKSHVYVGREAFYPHLVDGDHADARLLSLANAASGTKATPVDIDIPSVSNFVQVSYQVTGRQLKNMKALGLLFNNHRETVNGEEVVSKAPILESIRIHKSGTNGPTVFETKNTDACKAKLEPILGAAVGVGPSEFGTQLNDGRTKIFEFNPTEFNAIPDSTTDIYNIDLTLFGTVDMGANYQEIVEAPTLDAIVHGSPAKGALSVFMDSSSTNDLWKIAKGNKQTQENDPLSGADLKHGPMESWSSDADHKYGENFYNAGTPVTGQVTAADLATALDNAIKGGQGQLIGS